jgi:hypothetical protein
LRPLVAITIIATLSLYFVSFNAFADDKSDSSRCTDDTRAAVATARQSLHDASGQKDRAALECMIEAVAALDSKLQGLSDGSRPFEGQIYIPKGFIVAKPSVREDR